MTDNIERNLLHHTQQKMRRRLNILLDLVSQAGSQGVEKRKLEETMLINGIAAPPKTREYLSYLLSYGKVVEEEGRVYMSNLKTIQAKIDTLESYTHVTHTRDDEVKT